MWRCVPAGGGSSHTGVVPTQGWFPHGGGSCARGWFLHGGLFPTKMVPTPVSAFHIYNIYTSNMYIYISLV